MPPVQKRVTYRVTRPCSTCGGSGREICFRCSGTGMIYVPIYGSDQRCPNCGGSGVGDCCMCHGTGTQESYETRWETEWADDPIGSQSGSYSAPAPSASSRPSSRRSRRRTGGLLGRIGRAVYCASLVIIGAELGSRAGHMWLGILLAIVIYASTKEK